jgi:superfamily I DNA/RNA helicase
MPFSHVVIDEAQDTSVPELLLLGGIFGNRINGHFSAGDIGQRIFRAPFPWTAAGVELKGRSRSLKVNSGRNR